MSTLSRCYSSPAPRSDGSAGGILAVLTIAVLFLLFGLAHLRMQFAVKDLQRETGSLQSAKMDLKSKINALRNEVEAQKQGAKLLEYASAELGMVKYPPTEWEKIRVSDSMATRFSGSLEVAHGDAEEGPKVSLAESLASRIGIAGQAFAGVIKSDE